jgi:hypothetical protein
MLDRCRAGVGDTYSDREADLPAGAEHIDVRLIDQPGVNQHLDFVLLDTVRVVEQLRWAGRKVLIHCVQAQSRMPAAATLYWAWLRGIGIAEALTDVRAVLPDAHPIPEFREALHRLHPWGTKFQATEA